MILKRVKINKYKSFLTEQSIELEKNVTRIVGKNESGKTAVLESLAKYNYFENDSNYEYNSSLDYPRSELVEFEKTDKSLEVIICDFEIDDNLMAKVENDCGKNVLGRTFTLSKKYNKSRAYSNYSISFREFLKHLVENFEISDEIKKELTKITDFNALLAYCHADETLKDITTELNRIINENSNKEWNPLSGYIFSKYITPNIPKFWYFDEYFALPSRIDLTELTNNPNTTLYSTEEKSIINALFELSSLNIQEIINSTDFERFTAILEATSNKITDDMFKYWTTNKNLEIEFKIEIDNQNHKVLNIRIKNTKHRVTLPLKNRSKGFIWFFSFLVWFSRIQGKKDSSYILLLDEPGLNLHAAAQGDLLKFIDDELSSKYQVIYTTHSPFMIESNCLNQVRTVYDSQDPKVGSVISDVIQEKDPDTLFPLQAALGYDLAQNLYVSKNNLLVEGVSDLIFIESISEFLKSSGKQGLNEDITIVPTGGLDKVASFISLLRGSKLNIICLLDNFTNQKGQQRLDDLIKNRIIKDKNILFFGEFAGLPNLKADLEDMFGKSNYVQLFNEAFKKDKLQVSFKDIKNQDSSIIPQLNALLKVDRFNHYKPANEFLKTTDKSKYLDDSTIEKFENMFTKINKLFSK